MLDGPVGRSVAIFFYAGDFVDVLRRHAASEQQIYATHGEVAQLILDLRAAGVLVTLYSYVTDERRDESPLDGVRIVSLGAKGDSRGVLADAVAAVDADTIVAHFAFPELLKAAIGSGKRVFVGMANSYNGSGPRHFLRRLRIARLLNSRRIRMISNHCVPATAQLAQIGVDRDKLVPWDIPHRFSPASFTAKTLEKKAEFSVAYAGSIAELKGVGDLIQAIALLDQQGIRLTASFAGLGDIAGMQAMARSLGIEERLRFHGIIGNEDVFAMFRDADIVAVPSRTAYPEGFPLTMFEAIASRSPIVCSDHPMFRPVLTDGAHCAMFPSGDVPAFAAAMQRVLTSAELYGHLSGNAETTWARLQGPADWRTLIAKWVTEGETSPWVAEHRLDRAMASGART